jgi:acetylornithine deacetylase
MSDQQVTIQSVIDGIRRDRLTEITAALCDAHSPTGAERDVALQLRTYLGEAGLRTELQEVEDDRFNVIGRLEGSGDGPSLMFNGHLDTSYPFMLGGSGRIGVLEAPTASRIVDGWLYGTGADNMKAAFACYIGAIEALRDAGVSLKGDILVSGVVGEVESSPVQDFIGSRYRGFGVGTRNLVAHGGFSDYCIIGEPSNLKLGLGNNGAIWAKVTTHGPVMGSYRALWSENAIVQMTNVIEALHQWREEYVAEGTEDGPRAAISISAIQGGWPARISRSPGACSIFVDVRTLPGQPLVPVMKKLRDVVQSVESAQTIDVDYYATVPGSEISPDSHLVDIVRRSHVAVHGREPGVRYSQATADAAHFRRYGIETLLYGPGGARMPDNIEELGECVLIDNLVDCTKVYALAALELCGFSA